jgi:hypothetical protein
MVRVEVRETNGGFEEKVVRRKRLDWFFLASLFRLVKSTSPGHTASGL